MVAVVATSIATRTARFAIIAFFAVCLASNSANAGPPSPVPSASITFVPGPVSVSDSNPDAAGTIEVESGSQRTTNTGVDTDIDRLIQESLDNLSASMNEFHAAANANVNASTIAPRPRRPFVTLAYAQSIDGKIALKLPLPDEHEYEHQATSENLAISGPESFRLTHALRSIHDAILVGGNTLAIDNPRLNNRLWETTTTTTTTTDQHTNQHKYRSPRPVVLDTHLTHTLRLGSSMRATNPIVCCSREAYDRAVAEGYGCDRTDRHRNRNRIRESNNPMVPSTVTLLPCKTKTTSVAAVPPTHGTRTRTRTRTGSSGDQQRVLLDLSDVLSGLYQTFGIRSVMVEGGAGVIGQFVAGNYVDDDNDEEKMQDKDKYKAAHQPDHHLVDCLCVTISPQLFGARGLDSISSSPAIVGPNNGRRGRFGPLRCIALGDDCVLFSNWQQQPQQQQQQPPSSLTLSSA